MKPFWHWYLTRELISYLSRFCPKVRAFSTMGGWLQATGGTARVRSVYIWLKPEQNWFVCLLCQRCFGASRTHTCSLFASEGQVVVARHVVPLAVLVPDHDDAVLARREEAVRLVGPPVLVLLSRQRKDKKGKNFKLNLEATRVANCHSTVVPCFGSIWDRVVLNVNLFCNANACWFP